MGPNIKSINGEFLHLNSEQELNTISLQARAAIMYVKPFC